MSTEIEMSVGGGGQLYYRIDGTGWHTVQVLRQHWQNLFVEAWEAGGAETVTIRNFKAEITGSFPQGIAWNGTVALLDFKVLATNKNLGEVVEEWEIDNVDESAGYPGRAYRRWWPDNKPSPYWAPVELSHEVTEEGGLDGDAWAVTCAFLYEVPLLTAEEREAMITQQYGTVMIPSESRYG